MTPINALAVGGLLIPTITLGLTLTPGDFSKTISPKPISTMRRGAVPMGRPHWPASLPSSVAPPGQTLTSLDTATRAPVSAPSGSVATSIPGRARASLPAATPSPTARASGAPPAVGRWVWPLSPVPAVVHGFIVGPDRWSTGHRGVDLAAGIGVPVRAPAGGIVHFVGVIAGRPVLSLDHGAGWISSVEPVVSSLHRGQVVRSGVAVGRLATGLTHCAPATCLHWGVRKDGHYINPLLLVHGADEPAVLLPLLAR